MTKKAIIQKTIKTLNMLPEEKLIIVADFAEYLLEKEEQHAKQNRLESLIEQSQAYYFLHGDDDIYTADDIKEKN
jgi:choline kinase